MLRLLLFFVVLSIAGATVMQALFGSNSERRVIKLKSYNGRYLSEDIRINYHLGKDEVYGFQTVAGPPGIHERWTITQVNDKEVTLKSNEGQYISHAHFDEAKPAYKADAWEMLIPKNNTDGSWSFVSRYGKWLSAHRKDGVVEFMPSNLGCEHWWIEAFNPHGRGAWSKRRQASTQILQREISFGTAEAPEMCYSKYWEMLTPKKNDDGSWSFKSRYGRWLSNYKDDYIDFMPENLGCAAMETGVVIVTYFALPFPVFSQKKISSLEAIIMAGKRATSTRRLPDLIRKDPIDFDSCEAYHVGELHANEWKQRHRNASGIFRPDPFGINDYFVDYSLNKKQRWTINEDIAEMIGEVQDEHFNIRVSASVHSIRKQKKAAQDMSPATFSRVSSTTPPLATAKSSTSNRNWADHDCETSHMMPNLPVE
ncbi:hypothetical protein PRIPAC_71831 [Pristionchus pacificus]|uniref:Uncharacterized protein n=1 Tax=Pristionchus pacificus TaxID=54126 RepID=A0A2A6C5X3_PRIPA|nr:hypothetical protein PRIPAC_71831 [Pristionchus pacificus]|eukprot:PDM73516.1 hypothetical protein PRIPAC_40872 [Pristionchus pacificus]